MSHSEVPKSAPFVLSGSPDTDRHTYKLISCNVFRRDVSALIAAAKSVIFPEFLDLGLHEESGKLQLELQAAIDRADAHYSPHHAGAEPRDAVCEAILLAYGICGNGLAGITARTLPLVIPRAHDCCTILLGSKSSFLTHFGQNLSASWSSAGYIEAGLTYFRSTELGKSSGLGSDYDSLVAEYGEENARFIWDTMHATIEESEIRYIDTPHTRALGYSQTMKERAAAEGKTFIPLEGSDRLLRNLLEGNWDSADFLVVPPGHKVKILYDHEAVIDSEAATSDSTT